VRWSRLLLLAALALLVPAGPAAADFRAVSSASFEGGPLPRGSYITIFTDAPVTDETVSNPFPWPDSAGGVSVDTDGCAPGVNGRLPVLFVGPANGGTQINVYYPNSYDTPREPFGTCLVPGPLSETLSVTPKAGFGGRFSKTIMTVAARPALWTNGDAPDGFHVDAVSGARTPLVQCNASPARCPVTSGGRLNRLSVLTSGIEIYSCPVPIRTCEADPRVSFRLTAPGGQPVEQPLDSLGLSGIFAKEQATVLLRAGTVPGAYRLSVRVAGNSLPSSQQLLVRLGGTPPPSPPPPPPAPPPPSVIRPSPFVPIVHNSFSTRGAFTRFTRLSVSNMPAGSRVELACGGRSCPFKRKRFQARKGNAALLPALKRRRLRAGARLEVRVVGPQGELKIVRFYMRRGKPPRKRVQCAPAGGGPLGRCR
jgi:uncharacterized protein (TIGR03437 family)